MNIARGLFLSLFTLPMLVPVAQAQTASEPIGVAECDQFIAAYQACARSPGVPDNLKTAIQQGVDSLTTSLRQQSGRGSGRNGIAAQCVQMHASVRANVVSVFKCDFPTTPAVLAAEAAEKKKAEPLSPAAQRAARETAKMNAYTAVQNNIVDFYHFETDLNAFTTRNRAILSGAKIPSNTRFEMPIREMTTVLNRLRDAVADKTPIPEVDKAAANLLLALEEVDPIIAALRRYESTRAYEDDRFQLARDKSPALIASMKNLVIAVEAYSEALFNRELARDEKLVTELPKGSLAQLLISTSLSARRVVAAHDNLTRANTEPFAKALAALNVSNTALTESLRSLKPPADSDCKSYAERIDTLTGEGRDMLRKLRDGGDPSSESQSFIKDYNQSVENLNRCQRDEDRAKPQAG